MTSMTFELSFLFIFVLELPIALSPRSWWSLYVANTHDSWTVGGSSPLGGSIAMTSTGMQGVESPRPLHIMECWFPFSYKQMRFFEVILGIFGHFFQCGRNEKNRVFHIM